MDPEEYQAEISQDVAEQLANFPCQPVLFAGAGLSIRWFGAPSWQELLERCIDDCPEVVRPFAYYAQSAAGFPEIATVIAGQFREWAWKDGNNSFPDELFHAGLPGDAYLKHYVACLIAGIDTSLGGLPEWARTEISAFQSIRPHCLITTNFDMGLEAIFPEYAPILGDDLVLSGLASVGEIVKIHGSCSRSESLVLTAQDYENFIRRRKYLSAKLLTFFTEHPILFVGYSAGDQNVCGILSDIDEALSIPGDLIPNIYFLERPNDAEGQRPRERLIKVADNRSVRVKCIQAADFSWAFRAFGHRAPLENVNPRILRSILARSYHLVRSDIPRQQIEVDFDFIAGQVESDESFARLFGVATLQPAAELAARYPYNLTEVGRMIGGNGWHIADRLLKRIRDEKGIDLKAADNAYHMEFRTGRSVFKCPIPDDHIDPRRTALFMARSILCEVRDGVGTC